MQGVKILEKEKDMVEDFNIFSQDSDTKIFNIIV